MNELGKLLSTREEFIHACLCQRDEENQLLSPRSLKSVRPTRCLTRLSAVKAHLEKFSDVLTSLQDVTNELETNIASRPNDIFTAFLD